MSKNYSIRRLGPSDAACARELLQMWLTDDGEAPIVESSDAYLTELLSRDTFHMVVGIVDGEIVGGATGYELDMYKRPVREMFFYEIGVARANRQQGIGRALIEELKAICVERGLAEMYVLTDSDNVPANQLYAGTGGKPNPLCVYYEYDVNGAKRGPQADSETR